MFVGFCFCFSFPFSCFELRFHVLFSMCVSAMLGLPQQVCNSNLKIPELMLVLQLLLSSLKVKDFAFSAQWEIFWRAQIKKCAFLFTWDFKLKSILEISI